MIFLKQERERKRMSQAELARLSGVKQQSISKIERGERRNPGIETISALARALGCGLHELYVPDAEPKSDNVDGNGQGQATKGERET